jgi:hypothetical protein
MILGATDQKLWMFEVLRRSLGRACMCWSPPPRVDHKHKKRRAGGKKIGKKGYKARKARCRPVGPQIDTWPCGPAGFVPFFSTFFINFFFFLEVWGMGQGF